MKSEYPLTFSVDYPNRQLNRATTIFRLFLAIPIVILISTISSANFSHWGSQVTVYAGGGLLFVGPLLMIVFRQKYPRWWFDWNLNLVRFSSRVGAYLALMDDKYPSTDEEQSVHVKITYPNVKKDLNRWLPIVKWFLAIPHYLVLIVLNLAAAIGVVLSWFSIIFTGIYPKSLFEFVEGVFRWDLRVLGYAFLLTTDIYPPFTLNS